MQTHFEIIVGLIILTACIATAALAAWAEKFFTGKNPPENERRKHE